MKLNGTWKKNNTTQGKSKLLFLYIPHQKNDTENSEKYTVYKSITKLVILNHWASVSSSTKIILSRFSTQITQLQTERSELITSVDIVINAANAERRNRR